MDWLWIGVGIAVAGYFIGEGLKNFGHPEAESLLESQDADDKHELIREKEVHHFIGISKEDVGQLLQQYPDVPHIHLNGKVYYPKERLRQWLMEIGK
ncbi:DNA-binding protein [Sporolactobacillus sp. THM7-7]|nr:DNA-binding protein [Sporolactobacillus sp. THM7-7]